jgi:hypothetical protein
MLGAGEEPAGAQQQAQITDDVHINERARLDLVARAAERSFGLDVCAVHPIHTPLDAGRSFSTSLTIAGQHVVADLRPHSNRSDNFEIRVQHEDGSWSLQDPGPVRTYRGTLRGMDNAHIAVSLLDDGVHGAVLMPEGELYHIEPLALHLATSGLDDHMIYRGSDLTEAGLGLSCATGDEHNIITTGRDASERGAPTGCGGNLCVAEIAFDTDTQYASMFGSGTASRIEAILNTINMQYEAEVGITHDLSVIIVRNGASPYSSTAHQTLWNQLKSEWETNQTDVQRDVVHLLTGKNLDGSTVGFAPVDTVCSDQGSSLSQHLDPFAKMTDLVAHELGHNWGAEHCNCTSNTMNPTIMSANTFHPTFTVPDIEDARDSATCLEAQHNNPLALPWSDTFDDVAINPNIWRYVDSASLSGLGLSPPSGVTSLRFDGHASVTSMHMDTSELIDLTLEYYVERQGAANRPESGEDLHFEYQASDNSWNEFALHEASPASGTPPNNQFLFFSVVLPGGAQHSDMRIRISNPDGEVGQDDWFVDSITLTGSIPTPEPFDLIQPTENATGVALSPFFQWATSAKSDIYHLLVDDDPGFASPEIDLMTFSNSYAAAGDPLVEGRVYYWSVTADNSYGSTPSNPVTRSFSTTGDLPSAFFLALPVNASTIDTDEPLFLWQASIDADSYKLEIDNDISFASPVLLEPALAAVPSVVQYTIAPGILADDTTYFWRITAQNDLGDTVGQPDPASFTTDLPATACEGDANIDLQIDVNDISYVLFRLGDSGTPGEVDGDANLDGVVDVNDISFVLFRLGDGCPQTN